MAALVGVSTAAAQRQTMFAEEENMTPYTRDELDNDWEFKIVRAINPAFRSPDKFRQLLEEEARAGWIMLEKFDDNRVRFKRPRSARTQDASLPAGIDPYRTHYGISAYRYTALMILVGIALVLVIAGLAMALVFFLAGLPL
jgi:hypothetical protein